MLEPSYGPLENAEESWSYGVPAHEYRPVIIVSHVSHGMSAAPIEAEVGESDVI